jgi:hypothetical protein
MGRSYSRLFTNIVIERDVTLPFFLGSSKCKPQAGHSPWVSWASPGKHWERSLENPINTCYHMLSISLSPFSLSYWHHEINTQIHVSSTTHQLLRHIVCKHCEWLFEMWCNNHGDLHLLSMLCLHHSSANGMLLVGKPEGTRPLGKPRCSWVDYIEMDLGVVWTGLVWLRIETSGGLLWTW